MSAYFIEVPKPSPGPTGTGAPVPAHGMTGKAAQAVVTGGSCTLEGSMDGVTYSDIGGGAIATSKWIDIPWAVKWIRLNVTAGITGKVMLGYFNDGTR